MVLPTLRTCSCGLVFVLASMLVAPARGEEVPEIKPVKVLKLKDERPFTLGAFVEGNQLLISTWTTEPAPNGARKRQVTKEFVALWDVDNEKLGAEREVEADTLINSLGAKFYTTHRDAGRGASRLTVFNAKTGEKLRSFEVAVRPTDLLTEHMSTPVDGSLLALSIMEMRPGVVYNTARGETPPHRLCIWDADKGKLILSSTGTYCNSLDFSADGRLLAVGHRQFMAVVDVAKDKRLGTISAKDDKGTLMLGDWSFSPDANLIAGHLEGRAKHGLMSIDSPITPLTPGIPTVSAAPDAKLPQVLLWDVQKGKEIARFGEGELISTLRFAPTGGLLATVTEQGDALVLWDVENRKRLARLPVVDKDQAAKEGSVTKATFAFSTDGKTLVATTTAGKALRVWDLSKISASDKESPR
jgi:WD40 repeat protein